MDQPSQHIADRYQIELTDSWQHWFDRDARSVPLAGEFRESNQFGFLLDRAPIIVWPGLMLPDTLPLVGNEYGDWLCVRIDSDNRLGELLHWYHGGGDWIPVGRTIAEAVLHDIVDQFRPRVGQVLRGAAESTSPEHLQDVVERLRNQHLQSWLADSLSDSPDANVTPARPSAEILQAVINALPTNGYLPAVQLLEQVGWAVEASLCDQIEYALQVPIRSLASEEIPKRFGLNYEPDYVRWLFDSQQIPLNALHQIQEILHSLGLPPVQPHSQDWGEAERLALRLLERRQDLAWAVEIAGWAAKRRGDFDAACAIYFEGRFASAFSNQSIRMRSHGFDSRFGKSALAELWQLRDHLNPQQRADVYLQKVWHAPARSLQREVQEYWMTNAKEAMNAGQYAAAYESYYRAGWDIGAQRMTDYLDIFGGLIESARAAGWLARANVAATHLACLAKLLPPVR
ncbi:MAG: hypothetical protein SFV81_24455 [Pirellulaceae bacterium]|nr:hypothetical protein [Pirellulaceae bacterium]